MFTSIGDYKALLTKLEAVNDMLLTAGEYPVNSLSEDPLPAEVSIAVSILDRITEDVQRHGWAYNTTYDETLQRDSDNLITLPDDVLKIDVDYTSTSTSMSIVQRGSRLYDRKNQTYTLIDDVDCIAIVRLLDWDDIPDTARRYISRRAAREFVTRLKGSAAVTQEAYAEERAALLEMRRECREHNKPNMLNSPGTRDIVTRRWGNTWLT